MGDHPRRAIRSRTTPVIARISARYPITFIFMPCRSSPQIALHDIISYLKSLVSRKTKDLAYKQEKSVKNARFTGGKETGILR